MPIVHVNDTDMYYEIHGEGVPLLLLPGWGTEISTVSGLIADLARNYQIFAIDNRGTGRSSIPLRLRATDPIPTPPNHNFLRVRDHC